MRNFWVHFSYFYWIITSVEGRIDCLSGNFMENVNQAFLFCPSNEGQLEFNEEQWGTHLNAHSFTILCKMWMFTLSDEPTIFCPNSNQPIMLMLSNFESFSSLLFLAVISVQICCDPPPAPYSPVVHHIWCWGTPHHTHIFKHSLHPITSVWALSGGSQYHSQLFP